MMRKHLYGFLASLAILLPDSVLLLFPPRGGMPEIKEDMFLVAVEQIGRMGCLFFPAIRGIGKKSIAKADKFLMSLMLAAIVATALVWAAYVINGRHSVDLFRPVFGLPVPLAVIPGLYFILLAVLMRSYALGGFSVLFFIGHYLVSNNVWEHFAK